MDEERTHQGALLEDLQREMRGIAETVIERLDRIDGRLERLETTVERIDIRVGVLETKVDKLEAFAGDAQQRLGRIETHLQLNGSNPRKPTRSAPAKRSKKR